MIGKRTEEVLNRAVRSAFERGHEYFTLEHVLLSLLEESVVSEIIRACHGNEVQLRTELEAYLDKEVPQKSDKKSNSENESSDEENPLEHPIATLSIQRLIQRALFHVQSAGKDEIQPEDLFVAIFQSKDSFALHLLQKQKIERLDVLNYISHGVQKDTDDSEDSEKSDTAEEPTKTGKGPTATIREANLAKSASDLLKTYTVNLNEQAKKGLIDPLVGRQKELDRLIQTLCRRRKNNPLLVGEAGVGKTAIAEGLALRIEQNDVPHLLEKAQVFALDMGTLIAGAKFRGDFEQRLKKVLAALERKKQDGIYPIVLIDEIHTIIGAGSVSGGTLDAANLLKPMLARGELQCIGSTTYQEYRNVFEKDHALARRFQKIDVSEPTSEEAIQILEGLKSKFEQHHGVKYTSAAIRAAVELSVKHITDRFLPDKAIDLMDEVGAKTRIKRGRSEESVTIDAPEIEELVAAVARIPARSVSISQKTRLKNLERDLKITIFGQDHAIDALVTSIRLARSGLRTGERPVGAFLFCGPTGVGKTELSKQLALSMGVPFVRFDMSEYMEKHTVSRLIGAPPGYVGFEQAGLLTDAASKNPHSVILLDEIEKAHSDVWNILLQIMDYGTLTDNNGKKSDFRNTIIILTSNVGSRELGRRPIGVSSQKDAASSIAGAKRMVEQAFSPEFRNRLDSIIYFNPLDPVTIGQVVGKQLLELESQLLSKQVEVEVNPEVREWLAHKGYDQQMGARPMARLIQDQIKRPLSEEILFGALEHGGKVRVTLKPDGSGLAFEYTAAQTKAESEVDTNASAES